VPVDVLQQLLGHASLATTTIYTQPGRKRRIREIGKLYAAKKGG
jgi:site-specific recombinase XerD